MPVERVEAPLRAAPTDAGNTTESEEDAVNRRGPQVVCRVSTMPLVTDGGDIDGAIITMDLLDHRSADRPS